MTDAPQEAVPHGLADLPLATRRNLDVEKQRNLTEGLTSRHLSNAAIEQQYLTAQFARVLRLGKREG